MVWQRVFQFKFGLSRSPSVPLSGRSTTSTLTDGFSSAESQHIACLNSILVFQMYSRLATPKHLEILMWPLFALLSSSNLNNNSHIQLKLMWNLLAGGWNECNANLMSFCNTNRNGGQKTNSEAIIQSDEEYTYSTTGRGSEWWREKGREIDVKRPCKG